MPRAEIRSDGAVVDSPPNNAQVDSTGLILSEPVIMGLPSEVKVAGSHFDIGTIVGVVRFVLEGAISMRGASRICGIINNIAGRNLFEYPSHTTVQNFILRISLYLLKQNQHHDDWIWIADHTYSIGTAKVFVVLGIRLSHFITLGRPLQYQDLSVLLMLSVESSNGTVVYGQFKDLAKKLGNPLAILSDAGSDLHKGTELFQADHKDTISLYDIVHLVSRKIEKIMKGEAFWDTFRQDCCTCANAVRQSRLGHLKPPKPRTKARYMNIDREVCWGARALQILDRVRRGDLNERQLKRLPLQLVEAKFGWLDKYRDAITQWELLSLTGRQVISEVRRHGYGATTIDAVSRIAESTIEPNCKQFVDDVVATIKPMSEAGRRFGRLPSSSEILESLFGKGKRLLGGTSVGTTNSLTGQLLAMVGCTAQITPSLVRAALAACPISCLRSWIKENFDNGLHYTRSLDLAPTPEEQSLRKPKAAAIPNF